LQILFDSLNLSLLLFFEGFDVDWFEILCHVLELLFSVPKFVFIVIQIANFFNSFRDFLDRVKNFLELLLLAYIFPYFVDFDFVNVELIQNLLSLLRGNISVEFGVLHKVFVHPRVFLERRDVLFELVFPLDAVVLLLGLAHVEQLLALGGEVFGRVANGVVEGGVELVHEDFEVGDFDVFAEQVFPLAFEAALALQFFLAEQLLIEAALVFHGEDRVREAFDGRFEFGLQTFAFLGYEFWEHVSEAVLGFLDGVLDVLNYFFALQSVELNMLVFLQVVDFVIVAVNHCNVFGDLLDSLGPEVVDVDVDVSQDHVEPLLECAAAELVEFGVGVVDDGLDVDLHERVLGVVLDLVDDVGAVGIVLLALVFLDAQMVVELGPVGERADAGDVFVRVVEDLADFLAELFAVRLEHDGAFLFVEVGFDFENGVLDLLAGRPLLLVVLRLELLGRELEVLAHLVHDVERELQVGAREHDVLEFDEADQFFEVCGLGGELRELHLAVGAVADQRAAVVVAALVDLAVFDADPVFGAVERVAVVAGLLAQLLHVLVALLEAALALLDLALVFLHEVLDHLVHFVERDEVELGD
jgi:hypothetical protein